MLRSIRWNGRDFPFEGARTVPLRVIPEGARVLAARIHVSPAPLEPPAPPFLETIGFGPDQLDWGAGKTLGADFLEVDFRGRRTIAEAIGTTLVASRLQVDLGGMYMEVNQAGALRVPNDPLFTLSQAEQPANSGRFVLPSFEVTRLKLNWASPGRPAGADVTEVIVHSVPTNVSLHLADQPAFFVHQGALTQPVATGDFAPVLQEFLSRAPVRNGFYDIPVVIRSQNISRVLLDLEIDMAQEERPLPGSGGEAAFTYDFSGQPSAEGLVVLVPPNCQVQAGKTALKLSGSFDDTRVAFGPIGSPPAKGELVLAPLRGLPQAYSAPFRLPESVKVKSVDVLVRPVGAAAELRLDIRDDLDGKPGLNSLLPAGISFDAHPTATQKPQWISVPLTEETRLSERPNLWLSLQVLQGEAAWALGEFAQLEANTPARHVLHATSDGGLSWQASDAEARALGAHPMFRLRHAPPRFLMPIEVRVGSGSSARRVPLDRYEALGRVDFTLDTPELAAAINQHAAEHPPSPCREGEQLLNGDLQQWLQVGDLPQPPRPVNLTGVRALAFAPDGLLLYASAGERLFVVDPLLPESPRTGPSMAADHLAVSPDGRRIYAATGQQVTIIDAPGLRKMGQVLSATSGGAAPAATIGGVAASAEQLFLLDRLQDSGAQPQWTIRRYSRDTLAFNRRISGSGDVHALAVSPDGRHVYVGQTDQILVFDANLNTVGNPIPGGASSIAPLADGKRALIVREGTLLLLDLLTGFVEAFAAEPGDQLTAVATPASTFDKLAVLRTQNESQAASIIQLGTRTPEAWDLTTGKVRPAPSLGDVTRLVAWLGAKEGPVSALSQLTPVSAGCRYELTFSAIADQPGAVAEVIWRVGGCARARIEAIPIAAHPQAPAQGLVRHRLAVEAPAGVAQAEIRYRTISGVQALVGPTSFRPIVNLIANGDLQPSAGPGEIAEGWTLLPEAATNVSLQSTPQGARLENAGAGPVDLVQEVPIRAGIPFVLEADVSIEAVGARPPVLQLHWLHSAAPFVELALDPEVFGAYVARGTVPSGVEAAELHLVLPAGTSVTVTLIRLRLRPPAEVPIEIVSHAPGQLRASDFVVVTDETPPAPPPAPEQGLCPPTKPGADPDDPEDCDCCPCCGDDEPPTAAEPRVTAAGRAVTLVACSTCGATRVRNFATPGTMVRPTARQRLRLGALALRRIPRVASRVAPAPPAPPPTPARRRELGLAPLLAVSILSQPARRALEASGILLSELAAADPDTVRRLAPELKPGTASALNRRARRLLDALEEETGG